MEISVSKLASYMTSSFKNLLILSIVLGSTSLVYIVLNGDPQLYRRFYWQAKDTNSIFYSDDAIRKMEARPPVKKQCPTHSLLKSNTTHIWVVEDNFHYYNLSSSTNIVCCYKSFYRPKKVDDITSSKIDNRVKYNSCRNFSDTIKVKDEFVRVQCNHTIHRRTIFDSFFLFAVKKKTYVKPKTHLPYNILILGIDGVSRLNLHRTMPKTVAVLNKLGAVEFLRHNKVGDNTFPNLVPLLLGKHATELPEICWPSGKMTFDNCPFIWHRFRQAGFLTAYGEDYVNISTFNYIKHGFAGYPTDYYLRTFLYEAERYAKSKQRKSRLLCMNENYTFKILLDYVEDLTALSKIKLFGIFWENTISHDKLNYPTLMDDDYTALFQKMHYSGHLNKSIIFLISDHGRRVGKFRKTRQGFLEDRLPFVIALMPPSFRKNFSEAYKNLKHNIHRLTTPFDVHATLSDLVNVKTIENGKIIARTNESYWNERSISLFLPIPENRTCKSAAIDAHWCVDYRNTHIDSNNYLARDALEHAVSHLNSLLEAYPHCAKLTLDKVLDVTRLLSDTINEKIKESIILAVTFRTNPGGGEFEATLGKQGGNNKSWILLGFASRLNAYGNQSHCIQDNSDAKLYCYCI